MADNLFNPSGLFEMLKQANLLPRWNQHLPYNEAYGHYNIGLNNLVALNPSDPYLLAKPERYSSEIQGRKNTAAHEMTHAVDYNLLAPAAQTIAEKLFQGEKVSKEEEQFLDTYKKISNSQIGRMGLYDSREADRNKKSYEGMLPKNINKKNRFDNYRISPEESIAFGVGNTSVPDQYGHEQLRHFDPSKATEVSIIMEMYKKLPKTLKETAASLRSEIIRQQRETVSGKEYLKRYDRNVIDLFEDPFASTIK